VFFKPNLKIILPFLPSGGFRGVALARAALNHQVDCLVDEFRLLTAPLSDLLSAVRALLLAEEALFYTYMTEGVTTDCSSAMKYKVHADGTLKTVDVSKDFQNMLLVVLCLLLESFSGALSHRGVLLYQLHISFFLVGGVKWIYGWLILVTEDSRIKSLEHFLIN
jgi:hypothetical protein